MALSGIQLSAGIVVGVNKPVDAKYGPYPDLATAKADIGVTLRYLGLTVGIITGGVVEEYYWESGTADDDLIAKGGAVTWGGITGTLSNQTDLQDALNLKLNTDTPALDYYISAISGAYVINGVNNATIYFEKGKKYRLHINASGHPFFIQTVSGAYSSGDIYNTGITGNGTDVGYILVELPQDAPQLYYACSVHSVMQGAIVTGDTFATYKALSNLANVDNTSDANKPVSTATQTALDTKTNKLITTNRQTASYTLVLADADKLVEMNVATANNLTIPLNSSVAFPIGTQILLAQYGAGQTTIVLTSGVTLNSNGGKKKLNVQYSGATLIKIAENEWYCFGDIVA